MIASQSISDFALIGDTRTAALVSRSGSVKWMCVPRFDAPSLFGSLIDDEGGCFSVELRDVVKTTRRYLDDSAVLRTDVDTSQGAAHITDAMVANVRGGMLPQNLLVRRVVCTRGRTTIRVLFDPRLGLPGRRPDRQRRVAEGLVSEWGSLAVALSSFPRFDIAAGEASEIELAQGESLTLVMSVADRCPVVWVGAERAAALVDETTHWWQQWSRALRYDGPHRAAVVRSLITLRLLTYSPSGAPVAAPTTSLPETPGGSRNWDYRYAWPRDAAIGLAAFLAVGNNSLAHSFMHWLLHASRLSRPRLRVLYDIHGKPAPVEREVGVVGFRESRPVRIGNDARTQHQLDVYGWVVDAAWLLHRSGHRIHGETWRALSGFADFVADNWQEPDSGIWEVRDDQAHYVHSKLMAWLALDRMTRMTEHRRVAKDRKRKWVKGRDALASWIRNEGVDPERGNLVWRAGSSEVDGSLLLLPVTEFETEGSSLVTTTIDAIRSDLEIAPGLLLRYPPGVDALEGNEGVFLPCSFWLVQALARTGKVAEANETFDRLLSYANEVGLFGEEMDPQTNEQLGNFPQAFTHATLVQAALALQAADATERQVS